MIAALYSQNHSICLFRNTHGYYFGSGSRLYFIFMTRIRITVSNGTAELLKISIKYCLFRLHCNAIFTGFCHQPKRIFIRTIASAQWDRESTTFHLIISYCCVLKLSTYIFRWVEQCQHIDEERMVRARKRCVWCAHPYLRMDWNVSINPCVCKEIYIKCM